MMKYIQNYNQFVKTFQRLHRIFFESKLAEVILMHSQITPAVKKISLAIIHMCTMQLKHLLSLFAKDPKICEDLYNTHLFGRLSNIKPSVAQMLYDILSVLQKNNDLKKIIHIHSVFIHRVYPKLINQLELSIYTKAMNATKLHLNDRGRSHEECKPPLIKKIGYCAPGFFNNRMRNTDPHLRAYDRFKPDCKSNYISQIEKHNLEFIAGPSGHCCSLLTGALLYGHFDMEEMKQYTLSVYAYLAGGGNHSFHEVYTIASKLVNIPYKIGEYLASLPKIFVKSALFSGAQETIGLKQQFGQYI